MREVAAAAQVPAWLDAYPSLRAVYVDWMSRELVPIDVFNAMTGELKSTAFSAVVTMNDIQRQRLLDGIGQAITDGTTVKELRDFAAPLLDNPAYADLVFGMNVGNAARGGQYAEIFGSLGADYPAWKYYALRDDRNDQENECPHLVCRSLDGKVFKKTDPVGWRLLPPNHFQCVAADTRVAGLFRTGFRSRYQGEMVEIETETGRRLTITIDHPVFTVDGPLPAGEIRKGAHVFRYVSDRTSTACINDQNGPPLAEKVFRALEKVGSRPADARRRVNLYGNAGRRESEIDVVTIDRILASPCGEDGGEFALVAAGAGEYASHAERVTFDSGVRTSAPAARAPRTRTLSLDSRAVLPEREPFQGLRFGATASLDAVFLKCPTDDKARNSALVSQAIDGGAGVVAFDQVVSIRKFDTSGRDVFDFEAAHGVILAQDICIGNCRCYVGEVSKDEAAASSFFNGSAFRADDDFDYDKRSMAPVSF